MKVAIFLVIIAVATALVVRPSKTPRRPLGLGSSKSVKIIGGEEAGDREFPFIVSLQLPVFQNYMHYCSGVIYDETRIITAGFCLDVIDPNYIQIVAGLHDWITPRGDEQTVTVLKYEIHENFDNPLYDNNIGIITLKEPLVFNQRVQPIRLALPGTEPTGEVVSAGWGTNEQDSRAVLHKVTLNVVNRDTCKEDLARIDFGVTGNMVCASAPGKANCEYDWGNPLIAKDEAQRPYLAGIGSFTFDPCGLDGFHSVFANIASLRDWVESKLNP